MKSVDVNMSKKLLQSQKPTEVEVLKSNRPGVVADELKKRLINFVRNSGDDSKSRHASENSLEESLSALRMGSKITLKSSENPKQMKGKPKVLRKSMKVLHTE